MLTTLSFLFLLSFTTSTSLIPTLTDSVSATNSINKLVSISLASSPSPSLSSIPSLSSPIYLHDHRIYSSSAVPYKIKGVNYSPIPLGDSLYSSPHGDYFTLDYAYIWERDLPLLALAGVNTIRIYGWNYSEAIGNEHIYFLNAVEKAGLRVLIGFDTNNANVSPVNTNEQQQELIDRFVNQVRLYDRHPAILGWSFGNELNGYWNGFVGQLSDKGKCGWRRECMSSYSNEADECWIKTQCVYRQLFGFINEALKQAKQALSPIDMKLINNNEDESIDSTRTIVGPLFTSAFTDVDQMSGINPRFDKVSQFGSLLPDLDFWAIQIYRGSSFGNYLDIFTSESGGKQLLVSEYGVDSYNDPCGWPENLSIWACSNVIGAQFGGVNAETRRAGERERVKMNINTDSSYNLSAINSLPFIGCSNPTLSCHNPGDEEQSNYDSNLTRELMSHSSVAGGLVFEYVDEIWKGSVSQVGCSTPCLLEEIENKCRDKTQSPISESSSGIVSVAAYNEGGSAQCGYHAHVTCSHKQLDAPDLCGYPLGSTFDGYANEEWFGLTQPISCTDATSKQPNGQAVNIIDMDSNTTNTNIAFSTTAALTLNSNYLSGIGLSDGIGVRNGHNIDQLSIRLVLKSLASIWLNGTKENWEQQLAILPDYSATCSELSPCYSCCVSNSLYQLTQGKCKSVCKVLTNIEFDKIISTSTRIGMNTSVSESEAIAALNTNSLLPNPISTNRFTPGLTGLPDVKNNPANDPTNPNANGGTNQGPISNLNESKNGVSSSFTSLSFYTMAVAISVAFISAFSV